MPVTIARPRSLRGEIIAPGDKSVSHRAIMFNALSNTGTAHVTNFSPGADCTSTVEIMRALGVEISRKEGENGAGDSLTVKGVGLNGLQEPSGILDAGNSGTTTRLMSGILAGRDIMTILTGDDSLSSRPMGRVVKPLTQMGAEISGRANDTLAPLVFHGGKLAGTTYEMPVASAQLKSCLLLAGLRADGTTTLTQPAESRDHTERMLSAMGVDLQKSGLDLELKPSELETVDVEVPGDISSAAFWLVAAICHPDAELLIRNVGINPTRAGIITALQMMNADLTLIDERDVAGEPVADMLVKTSELKGIELDGDIVPLLIDEIPVIAVAAAIAEGETVIRDAEELRVKESDRIAASISWLKGAGVEAEGTPDGMILAGGNSIGGGQFQSYDDHRLAMSLGVAGLISTEPITVMDPDVAGISYPSFWKIIEDFGGLVG
ncbi:3-phosphoshikimate 1-carboxyvinyltransferase [Candidatus Lucifugimonas marina]|uniref:3-phosphoshikimate 1-carboxyvinyltransferase n=1 Tax=Candidatus Lucifugimonas marina TaxID=3038979 RepID=A0AAJ5ZJQ2_9CHLR|nr:3-phosphoshikimate 1-carboxyvinyltransferase [SAR202 cluster bacterium JH702]MDG0868816.1 3-phosphoshikimate 1-carboxyvinyltransferase [SAR202 cluster bacterium JH639]WFG35446.1 3-phosphoshikimate 1-carboxyvinyltransferase [SAR202 cluster bacterium JH545]WFG39393.1 3-phosphoshikimate 1-carboxyvinyltransferase [SAR202 cluster bacterium JH1073]